MGERDWIRMNCENLRGYICEEDVPIHYCEAGVSLSEMGCPKACPEFKPRSEVEKPCR